MSATHRTEILTAPRFFARTRLQRSVMLHLEAAPATLPPRRAKQPGYSVVARGASISGPATICPLLLQIVRKRNMTRGRDTRRSTADTDRAAR